MESSPVEWLGKLALRQSTSPSRESDPKVERILSYRRNKLRHQNPTLLLQQHPRNQHHRDGDSTHQPAPRRRLLLLPCNYPNCFTSFESSRGHSNRGPTRQPSIAGRIDLFVEAQGIMAAPHPPNILPPINYTSAPNTAPVGGMMGNPVPGGQTSNADVNGPQIQPPPPQQGLQPPSRPAPLPLDQMRAYRACLNCRNRKSKCDLDINGGRPVSDFRGYWVQVSSLAPFHVFLASSCSRWEFPGLVVGKSIELHSVNKLPEYHSVIMTIWPLARRYLPL